MRSSRATFGGAVQAGDGVVHAVKLQALGAARLHLHAAALPGGGDAAHGQRAVGECGLADGVGVGEGRFLAGHGAHAHALVDAEGAALDDALFQAPALGAGGLEVEVGVVHAVGGDELERAGQRGLVQAKGGEQAVVRGRQSAQHGVGSVHGWIVSRLGKCALYTALPGLCIERSSPLGPWRYRFTGAWCAVQPKGNDP